VFIAEQYFLEKKKNTRVQQQEKQQQSLMTTMTTMHDRWSMTTMAKTSADNKLQQIKTII